MPSLRHPRGGGLCANTASVDPSAFVAGTATVGEFSYVGKGSYLDVGVTVGNLVLICCCVVIRSGVTIGNGVTIGEGNVITADVPAGTIVPPGTALTFHAPLVLTGNDVTITNATDIADGAMSAADKAKLDTLPVILDSSTIIGATAKSITFDPNEYSALDVYIRVTNGFPLTCLLNLDGLSGNYRMSEIYNNTAATVANYQELVRPSSWFTGLGVGPGFLRANIYIAPGGERTIDMYCRDSAVAPTGSYLTGDMDDTANGCTGLNLTFTGSPNVDILVRGYP